MLLFIIQFLVQTYKVNTIIIFMLQRRELRYREDKYIAKGHTHNKRESRVLNLGSSDFKIHVFNH